MMLKKSLAAMLAALTLVFGALSMLTACSDKGADGGKIKILCTVFPQYDWLRNIVGESEAAEVSLLVKNGADMHSYQPSVADMASIRNSDVVVYIGGESDKWIDDAIVDGVRAVKLSELDGIRLYETASESIAEHEEHGHSHDGEESFDEHLWLSVKNAAVACEYICDVLCELEPSEERLYKQNTESYVKELEALDSSLASLAEGNADAHCAVFADRFPFVYMLEDYGISYYAAFEGCTADTSADFDTVIGLAKKLDELKTDFVCVTEAPVSGLAQSVIAASEDKDRETVTFNSMQSLTEAQLDTASYLEIMRENFKALEKILK